MTDKRRVLLSVIFSFVLVFIGGTYAYWSWKGTEAQKTSIKFTTTAEFSCSVDGDGTLELTSSDVVMAPSSCTNSKHVIKKEINAKAELYDSDLSAYMDLWLEVKHLDPELSESQNFRYALTTSPDGCNAGTVIASGSFYNKQDGDRVSILGHEFTETGETKYYLYIWLDSAETNPNTASKAFQLQLGGECSNAFQPEAPVLDSTGLIPVTISNTGAATTISPNSSNWYNYANKQWANAVLVTSSSRSKYHGKSNVSVSYSDVLAYYVWIPRFKYKIWTTGVSSAGNEQIIDIMFERKENDFATGTTVGSYKTHPAFWWNSDGDSVVDAGEKLAGIWVGKFETAGTATQPTVKYNSTSLKNQIILGQFTSSLKFSGGTFNSSTGKVTHQYNDTYGLDGSVDSHMMKNSEWGAVAYLSQSIYGIGEQLVGGAGCGTSATANCIFTSSNGVNISTTDNLTGVYDMGNGTSERVMGAFGTSNSFTYFGTFPDIKYYDSYYVTSVSSCTIQSCGGHALKETNGWYSGLATFINSSGTPWFARGSSGSQFSYTNKSSSATGVAWRSVLVNVPSYIISYAANGGTGAPDNFRKMSGEDAILSSTIPTREGHTFTGWNTEADGSGTSYAAGGTYTADVGATLYAQWKDETGPTVTISSTTNNVTANQTVEFSVEDNKGVVGYYIGTNNPNTTDVSWVSIESVDSKELSANINRGGTWYFAAVDEDGNIGTQSAVFYQTSLVISNVNVSVSEILTMSGNSFTIPTPTGSTKFTFMGWYTTSDYSGDPITTYTPSTNGSIYGKVEGQLMSGGAVMISGRNMVGETLTANVTEVPSPTPTSYTYQWYSNSTNSTTGGTKLIGATYSTYKVSNALINKYIYVVVTAKHDDYLDFVMTDLTDTTNNHSAYADLNPVVNIGSTETINSTTQTATLKCTDNNGVVGYYFGKDANPTTYTTITSTTDMSLTSTVSSADTYYLFCKDENGNISSNSITYYTYRVHNMLETVAGNPDSYDTDNYEEVSVSSDYIMRSVLDTSAVPVAPVGSNISRLSGFSESNQPDSLKSDGTAIKLSGDTDLYFWYTRIRVFINFSQNGGSLSSLSTGGVVHMNLKTSIMKYESEAVDNILIDYNNYLGQYRIFYTGHTPVSGAEWICLNGCTVENQTYDYTASYAPEDFCNLSTEDCTVTLGVNWKANTYNVYYNGNGGTGTMESVSCTYNQLCVMPESGFTREGYTQNGWNTKSDGSGVAYPLNYNFSYVLNYSITLYAQWTPNTYTVSYDANGGTGSMESTTCTYGQNCILTSNSFDRPGYNFIGWATDSENLSVVYSDDYSFSSFDLTSDTVLYAVWKRKPIYAYFNVNGGQIDNSSNDFSVDSDGFVMLDNKYFNNIWTETTVINLENYNSSEYMYITKTGHSAKETLEWNMAADGSGTNFNQATDYSYDELVSYATENDTSYRLDLFVNWEANSYTITYVANGGTGLMEPTTCTYGQSCTLAPVEYTKLGYTFINWSSSAGGVGYGDNYIFESYDIDSDLTLTANWGVLSYIISYELNGGVFGESAPGSVLYDSVVNIGNPTKTLTIIGDENGTSATIGASTSGVQIFSGWTFDGDTSTALYGTTEDSVTTTWDGHETLVTAEYFKNLAFPGPVTLTAHWIPVSFNVPSIIQTGHTCKWNTEADGSGIDYESGAIYFPADDSPATVMLYAICTPETYIVDYDSNGGVGVPDSQIKTYGETLTLSDVIPIRDNYTFVGWYPDDDAATSATYAAGGTYTENKSTTMYAVWRPNQVLINFNVNGGSYTESTTKWDGSLIYNWTTDEDGTLAVNGNYDIDVLSYGGALASDGLANWNNPNFIELTHENDLVAKTGEEWKCINGCTTIGRTYDQADTTYTTDDFCDLTDGDCRVELAVNWVDETAPTCSLTVSSTGVTLSSKSDNVGVTEYGMGMTLAPTYNSITSHNFSVGTIYGYVKDSAGNEGSCSVLVMPTTSGTTNGTINCSSSNYSNRTTTACANAGYTGYRGSNSCSTSETFKGWRYECVAVDNGNTEWAMPCYCDVSGEAKLLTGYESYTNEASCQGWCGRNGYGVHEKSYVTVYDYEWDEANRVYFTALTSDYCTIGTTGNNMIAEDACSFNNVGKYYRDCTSNGVTYSGTISCYTTTYSCDTGYTKVIDSNEWCYK